jgi:hypothetical protein
MGDIKVLEEKGRGEEKIKRKGCWSGAVGAAWEELEERDL